MAEKLFGSAAVLAGGLSKRMGFDKQLLMINEKRLFDQIYNTLSEQFNDIIVNTYRPDFYIDYPVRTVQDFFPNMGPLAGIHCSLKSSDSKYVYIIACDMPHINLSYVNYMKEIIINEKNNLDACVTKIGNWIEPFNAFYSKNCLPVIEKDLMENKTSIRYFLKKVNTLEIFENKAREFSPDWSMFQNLNTKQLYEDYLNKLKFDYKKRDY